jgi:hypothetical protein
MVARILDLLFIQILRAWAAGPDAKPNWLAGALDPQIGRWDLAKATGQATDLEPDVAARLLVQIEPILPDTMRGPDGEAAFGPRVEIADSAPAADRLAAFEGRHP